MEIEDFINTCVDQGYAWYQGKHEEKEGYFVGCEQLGTKAHFTSQAVESCDWPVLRNQIVQGKDVRHITRVVGYYSRTENWNKSKLGELDDRHKGDYRIQEKIN